MAGNAQNNLGRLFVDIGVGGVGKALKQLNSISASFLLTKNAAVQAIKPFINIGKEAMNSAVGIGKMAAALSTSSINALKLQQHLKKYGSEGLESDVASLQRTFTQLKAGYGTLNGQMAMSMGQLGLDWQKYNGTFEDTLQYIQDVKDALKTSGMSRNEQIMHLQNLGLGGWQYLFEKPDFNIKEALSISDKEIENLIKASEYTEEIKNRIDNLEKSVSSGVLTKTINTLTDIEASSKGDAQASARNKARAGKAAISTLDWLSLPAQMQNFMLGGKVRTPKLFQEGVQQVKNLFNPLEVIPETDEIYKNSQPDVGLPAELPPQQTNVNINFNNRIVTNDPNTKFEILSPEEENRLTNGVAVNVSETRNTENL